MRRCFSSARNWSLRQSSDPYVRAARECQHRSRAAFKLLQLDEQYRLLRGAKLVVDLGAAPGGWSQVAAQKLGRRGRVVAIDLLDMEPLDGVTFLRGDFTLPEGKGLIREACAGQEPDLIISDMAPNISGICEADHLRSVELVGAAFRFARDHLAPGGHFIAKIFQGKHTKGRIDGRI